MIVTCKNCGTKFRINEKLIPAKGRKVKCSKCSNVFMLFPPTKIDKIPEDEEVFHLTDDESPKEDISEEEKQLEEDLEKIAEKYQKPKSSKKGKSKKGSKFSFIITMAMLIIAIFVGSIFVILKTKNKVPPFKFVNLTAQYYENIKFKKVLVIKGTLVNNRKSGYTKVKLKGLIFDSNGKKIREASTYVGNVFSNEEILNLTPEYVKKFVFQNVIIKPLQNSEFMIFFFDVPKISYSFQVEVVNYEKVKKR